MDTSGYYPQLGNNDPLFEIADYTQVLKTKLGAPAPVVPSFLVGSTWGVGVPVGNLSTTKFYIMNETVVATTDANGYFGITMPFTFPNGYQVGACLNGDDWARPSTTFNISTNLFTNTNNRFYVRAVQNGSSPVVNAAVRMNYIVTGW